MDKQRKFERNVRKKIRRAESLCELLQHCVTQTADWWPNNSPCGFNLNPTKRSKLLLNYLLLPLCFSYYLRCCSLSSSVNMQTFFPPIYHQQSLPIYLASAGTHMSLKHKDCTVTKDVFLACEEWPKCHLTWYLRV